MSDDKKDTETIPEKDDLLFAGQVRPFEEPTKSPGPCCTCTKKKFVIVAVILVMLLLYGIGLAIGLAVGMSKSGDTDANTSGGGDKQPHRVPIDAVVSDDDQCSDIGRDILARHGNAVDAAIATLICNGVKTPHSMGIGGGCFMIIYDRHGKKAITIDGRETSPKYMTPELYKNLSVNNVDARKIGVPGELMAYKEAHDRYGRLPWRDLFEPTIKLIREGFPLSTSTANALYYSNLRLQQYKQDFRDYPGLCDIFCADNTTGVLKVAGDIINWPNLADTFQHIADEGVDYIYRSRQTQILVDEIRAEGGVLSLDDFMDDYKANIGDALAVQYNNYTIYSMDGATGGPVIGLIMNILKRYEWLGLSTLEEKVNFYHKLLEAIKFAEADKLELGDPSYDNTTWIIEKMISEEYADIIRTKITEKTHPTSYYTEATKSWDDTMGTSHVSVLSNYGDAVSVTSTINWYFGARIVSNSTGIIWNNEMDDFDEFGKTNVNQIEAGKRPRSSMAPVIVVDNNNNVKLVTGGAGGSYIATSVAQVVAKLLFFDLPLQEVIDSKRVHHKLVQNKVVLEKDFPEDIKDALVEERGHDVMYYQSDIMSVIESIYVNDTIHGYADKRKPSGKVSYIYRQLDD